MTKIVQLIFIGLLLLIFASCKKCVTCTYFDNSGTFQTVESCRSNSLLLEAQLQERHGSNSTITCTEN
ncbi:MAG: hypothetical protein ACFB10_01135 [Salibacteraceae bacterium]